ncbi:MAG: hypothetical protein CK551_07765 [Planctomycetaceae bacterium]|nr:MAG: hypothetical protein CK551_07765 [Planctomycetaceae bacterium]
MVFDAEFNRTGPDAKRRDYSAVAFETLNDPNKKLDAVKVSDRVITILGIETGRGRRDKEGSQGAGLGCPVYCDLGPQVREVVGCQ